MFSKIPHALIQSKDISTAAFKFYCELSVFANFETGECWPSRQKISKRNGLTLAKITKELSENGFLIVEIRIGKPSKYKLLNGDLGRIRPESNQTQVESDLGRIRPTTQVESDLPRESNQTYELEIITRDNNKIPEKEKKTVNTYPEDFENFWKGYECKGSKKTSFAEWKKLSKEQKVLAFEKIKQYFRDKPEKQFRKDAERYLKGFIWESYEQSIGETIKQPSALSEIEKTKIREEREQRRRRAFESGEMLVVL